MKRLFLILPGLCLLYAGLALTPRAAALELLDKIDLGKDSSLVVHYDTLPALPRIQRVATALDRGFSPDPGFANLGRYDLFYLGKNQQTLLESLKTSSSKFGGVDLPFSLVTAATSKQHLFYIYRYQNRTYLNAAVRESNGVFRKKETQVLSRDLIGGTARFKTLRNGSLTLLVQDISGQTQSFRQDPAHPLKFKF